MGRWSWASAVSSWATDTKPRTPSRPSSWSWPARPGRSATPTCWETGCTGSRSAPRERPGAGCARRRRIEEDGSTRSPEVGPGRPAEQSAVAREEAEALHDEIDRLPVAFRLPVVLCYFEGLTVEEAARQLHWPHGTVRSRLARARDKLRDGLTRRGVALPATVLVAALAPRSGLGVGLIPPVRHHDPGRVELRGRTGRLAFGDGPCPGGAEIHADPQTETLAMFILLFLGAIATGAGLSDSRPCDEG